MNYPPSQPQYPSQPQQQPQYPSQPQYTQQQPQYTQQQPQYTQQQQYPPQQYSQPQQYSPQQQYPQSSNSGIIIAVVIILIILIIGAVVLYSISSSEKKIVKPPTSYKPPATSYTAPIAVPTTAAPIAVPTATAATVPLNTSSGEYQSTTAYPVVSEPAPTYVAPALAPTDVTRSYVAPAPAYVAPTTNTAPATPTPISKTPQSGYYLARNNWGSIAGMRIEISPEFTYTDAGNINIKIYLPANPTNPGAVLIGFLPNPSPIEGSPYDTNYKSQFSIAGLSAKMFVEFDPSTNQIKLQSAYTFGTGVPFASYPDGGPIIFAKQ